MKVKSVLSMFFMLGLSIEAYGVDITIDPMMLSCFRPEYMALKGLKYDYMYVNNNEGIYQDTTGDAPEFIDLTTLKVKVDDKNIVVDIVLAHIPRMLIFDRADIANDDLEYEWSVSFDVDKDGTPANDISIALSSYKFEGDKPSIGYLHRFTQHDVGLWGSSSVSSLTTDIEISNAEIINNSIISINLSKSKHKALNTITAKTPIRFSTYYNFGGAMRVCEDFYPDLAKLN